MKAQLVILGAGESGTGAALLANARGYAVFVSDHGTIADRYRQELDRHGIAYEENGHSPEMVLSATEIIKSPGISFEAPIVVQAMQKGISIIDELEFASRFTKARFLAVTGSNGKTTTTLLAYHLMKGCGFSVGLAGNVGQSLARQVIADAYDWYVLEVSSFQLDGMRQFRADIGIITNITPDHLDRYQYRFENYVASKFRLLQNMDAGCHFIYHSGDPVVAEGLKHRSVSAGLVSVGLQATGFNTVFMAKASLVFNHLSSSFIIPAQQIPLQGAHNMLNAMMAIAAVTLAGADPEQVKASVSTFKNAPHRCETIAVLNGVTFINDSKATNVDSVKYAFSAFKKPIVWIAGGVDKGNDYHELDEAVAEKVTALVCLGKDNAKLKAHFQGKVKSVFETQSVKEAIEWAFQVASPGTAVLLSPACASFDLFKNYEDRGNQFRSAVLQFITTNTPEKV